MSFLTGLVERSRTTLSMLLIVVIAGIYSYRHIPVESTASVDLQYVSIIIMLDGVSPEDGVRLLIKPSEAELRNLSGLKEMMARGLEGYVNIVLQFDGDTDLDVALNDVRAAMMRAQAEFPDEAREPIIRELTSDQFPVIAVGLVSEGVSERVLYHHAHALKRKIQTLPNVLQANVIGGREEVLEVVVDNGQLQAYEISSSELIQRVQLNNLLIPAGDIDTGKGRFSVKLPGLIEDYRDLYNLPLKSTSEGVVRLGDVAEIRRTFKDATTITLVNGKPAMSIEVSKRSSTNMIEVANSVRELLVKERANLPEGIRLVTVFDSSPFALQMVEELEGNIITALVLVVAVLVAALGLRSSILVSLGVPFSMMGGITIIYLLGFTFNFMVLFGLLLAIGMIVDGAIVIAEYADCKMADGMKPKDAYIAASKRMFAPATASMLTTLAAFLPMIFWPGIDGQFMRILPVTVFAVLGCSLLFALIVLPVLGAMFGKPNPDVAAMQSLQELHHNDPYTLKGFTGFYARVIREVLLRPWSSFFSMLFMLVAIFIVYGQFNHGTQYFTESEGVHGEVNISTKGNLSAQESAELVREVEEIVRSTPNVMFVYATAYPVGSAQGRQNASEDEIGHLLVELVPFSEREETSKEIFWNIRERTKHLSGIRIYADSLKGGPPISHDIQIEFRSENQAVLEAEALRIRKHLEQMEGVVDVTDTLPLPGIEWVLEVDRTQAALYGASVADAGVAVQLVTNGVLIGKYRPDDAENEVDIRVRYPAEQRNTKALDELMINTGNGAVPIGNFVKRVPQPHVNKLQRINGSAVVSVFANAAIGVLPNDKIAELESWLQKDAGLDPRVHYRFRGATENQEESTRFLGIAFGLAMLLMMAMMVAQFNSFYQTFLVLSSVVMSTAGVLLGHLIFQQPFSIILGGVGIVALAGVIVHNNIILLDTYNHLRRDFPQMDLVEVAVRTGVQRLRPVFLTVVTAGLGLLHLALGVSIDLLGREITMRGQVAGYWKPLASSLIYGLTFATILTLVLTPMMMVIPERIRKWREERGAGRG